MFDEQDKLNISDYSKVEAVNYGGFTMEAVLEDITMRLFRIQAKQMRDPQFMTLDSQTEELLSNATKTLGSVSDRLKRHKKFQHDKDMSDISQQFILAVKDGKVEFNPIQLAQERITYALVLEVYDSKVEAATRLTEITWNFILGELVPAYIKAAYTANEKSHEPTKLLQPKHKDALEKYLGAGLSTKKKRAYEVERKTITDTFEIYFKDQFNITNVSKALELLDKLRKEYKCRDALELQKRYFTQAYEKIMEWLVTPTVSRIRGKVSERYSEAFSEDVTDDARSINLLLQLELTEMKERIQLIRGARDNRIGKIIELRRQPQDVDEESIIEKEYQRQMAEEYQKEKAQVVLAVVENRLDNEGQGFDGFRAIEELSNYLKDCEGDDAPEFHTKMLYIDDMINSSLSDPPIEVREFNSIVSTHGVAIAEGTPDLNLYRAQVEQKLLPMTYDLMDLTTRRIVECASQGYLAVAQETVERCIKVLEAQKTFSLEEAELDFFEEQ